MKKILLIILVAIVVAGGGLIGWRVWQQHKKAHDPSEGGKFLVIKEWGVRFKLTPSIEDAYYIASPNLSPKGKPAIALYVHSLDIYPHCNPAQQPDSLAYMLTFNSGQTDQVIGNFAEAYPNAPLIGGVHYAIGFAQYDCSGGRADNFSAIHKAFLSAYPTISAY